MSDITAHLKMDIESLVLGRYYTERICMWQVS